MMQFAGKLRRWINYVLAIVTAIFLQTLEMSFGASKDIAKDNQACLNALLANVVTTIVRNVFHQYKRKNPRDLYQDLLVVRGIINKDVKDKNLTKEQSELLLPTNKVESYSSLFDISLLLYALTHLCSLKQPSNGWFNKPKVHDYSQAAQFVRIRLARNKFIHTPVDSFDDVTFGELWSEFREATIYLGGNQNQIDMFDKRSPRFRRFVYFLKFVFSSILAQAIAVALFLHEITLNYFFRSIKRKGRILYKTDNVSMYYERKDLLEALVKIINERDANIYGLVIAGPGGIGKTETAKALCNKLKCQYKHIVWMAAEKEQEIKQDFLVLYHNLKLDYKERIENSQTKYDAKTIAYKVYDFFSDDDAIFVFDNVVKYEDIKDFLPVISSGQKSPVIIITSQNKEWNKSEFIVKEIGVFREDEAINFFNQNWNNDEKGAADNVTALVNELGCLPLALITAVSYLNDNLDYTVEKYLEEYREYTEDILGQEITDSTGYNKTVLTTWKITMQKLKLPSIRLMQLLSYFDGKKIKKNLLTNLKYLVGDALLTSENQITSLADGPKLNNALKQLNKYSLINETYTNSNKEKCISVHSLIQTVVRLGYVVNEYKTDHSLLIPKVVIEILNIAVESDNGKQTHYNYGIDWINHLTQALKICGNDEKVVSYFLAKNKEEDVEDALISKGNYRSCFDVFQILNKFAKDEPKHSKMLSIVAYALLKMGKYKNAEEEYKKVVIASDNLNNFEMVGEESKDKLVSAEYFIAHCRMKQEDYKTAIEKLNVVAKKQMSIYTKESREYLLSQHDIAYSKFKLARYEEALKIFKEIIEQQNTVCGEYDRDTLLTSHSIGHTLIELGRYEDAKSHLQETLRKKKIACGELHHETLITHHTLGLALLYLKELQEARMILTEVYNNKIKALGKENPSTLTTHHRLGNCLMEDSMFEDALSVFQEVLGIRKRVLGAEKERTLMTENDIGYCYMKLNKYSNAIEYFERIDEIQVRLFSEKKINTMITKLNLGICYMKLGIFDKSLELFEKVRTQQKRHFGKEHEKTKLTEQYIGECLTAKFNEKKNK